MPDIDQNAEAQADVDISTAIFGVFNPVWNAANCGKGGKCVCTVEWNWKKGIWNKKRF